MRRPNFLRAVLPALVFALPVGAQSQIDFHEYASPWTTEYQAAIGAPLTAGGLDFYNAPEFAPSAATAGMNALATWGFSPDDPASINRPSNIGSATTIFSTVNASRIDILAAGTDPFAAMYPLFGLVSLDVAHLYSDAYLPSAFPLRDINLRIFGFGPRGASFFQDFLIPISPAVNGVRQPMLHTLNLDTRFQQVQQVSFFNGSGAYGSTLVAASGGAVQFTTVVSTPEPGTMMLLGTGISGLAGLAARRRRKRPPLA